MSSDKKEMVVFYRRLVTLVLVFHAVLVSGQDVHFSQYFNNPLFIYPAHAGNGINYVRASVVYRNQWNSVASPFSSQSIAVDKAVNRFGFGALFTNNSAGSDGIEQMNILGNLTYIQPLDADKINKIAIGVQFGIMQKSFDPSKMTFDNQYSVDHGFDPNASNGEVFANTTINRPDINAGILYTRNIGVADKKFKPFAGFSVHHLTQPRESFIIDENKLPLKFTANAGAVGGREVPLPGLADATSRLAVPGLALGQLVVVLMAETNTPVAFTPEDEALLTAVASVVASAVEAARTQDGADTVPVARPLAPVHRPESPRVRYFAVDGSTFLDDEYLIKGVAGRILWSLLGHYDREGRTEFTNKEVRLDPSLELPDFRDNLESRLILLKRRLVERNAPLRIEKTGRGRFRLASPAPGRLSGYHQDDRP